MDITAAECRELLNHLRFQVRGTGWVSVDELLTEEFQEERIASDPFGELRAYLSGIQERIVSRSAFGLYDAVNALNQTLGKDGKGMEGILLQSGDEEPRPLIELLPTDKSVTAFLEQLREIEYYIANARYLDEREGMGGSTVTP